MVDKQRLTTLLLGGAIGALAGVFLAPRSGRELRSNIANRAGEVRERSRETYFETSERLQERFAETRGGGFARPEPEPEATLGQDVSPEEPANFTERPRLREVSSEVSGEESQDTRSEELRKKVQETRARLRGRLEASGPESTPEDRDE